MHSQYTPAVSPALRQILRSRAPQVRARLKTLLSAHPHPARARLSGVGLLPAALMRADTHAAACAGGGVGGRFIDGGVHGADRRFFCPVELLNSAQQGCGVLSDDTNQGV